MPDLTKLSLGQLRARQRRAVDRFPDVAAIIRGSLQSQHRRCGRPSCRCARGELHGPYIYLALRGAGRNQLVYIPAELEAELRRRVLLSERVERSLAEISAINLELLSRGALD